MKHLLFVIGFVLVFGNIWAKPEDDDSQNGRIINGYQAEQGYFPWQVGINHYLTTKKGLQFCGGSLISDEWVLTAGHCVYQAYDFLVILGASRTDKNQPGSLRLNTLEAKYHPQYNPNTLLNDVAVIRLERRIVFNDYMYSIRLANSNDYLGSQVNVRVSGWGKISDNVEYVTNQLMYTDLVTITNAQCKDYYQPQLVQDNVVCCDGSQNRSTCNGDSGGPLIRYDNDREWTLVGVVSFVSTEGCAKKRPTGFARVASQIKFINDNTGLGFA